MRDVERPGRPQRSFCAVTATHVDPGKLRRDLLGQGMVADRIDVLIGNGEQHLRLLVAAGNHREGAEHEATPSGRGLRLDLVHDRQRVIDSAARSMYSQP